MEIKQILEEKEVYDYLKSRNLIGQYKKVKMYLLQGYTWKVNFKKRKPKGSGIYYFRINKKFRALGYFRDENIFVVVEIDDHQ